MSRKRKSGFIVAAISVLFAVVVIAVAIYAFSNAQNDLQESAYPLKYQNEVNAASQSYGVDKSLIYAVIRTESGFDPEADSRVGASGLMQLMPTTFEWLQTYYDGEITMDADKLLDPKINIDYGTKFLKFLLERYESEQAAIAAYNAGFGAVDGWLSDSRYSSDGVNLDTIPYDETSNYVVKVEDAREKYRELYHL